MNNIQKNKFIKGEAKNMKKKKGFTLIELIAVIAILGILAVVLVPNIIGYTNKAKISKAQSDAGIIIRAIDAYEAETSETSTTAIVSNVTTSVNDEASITLATLKTNDTTGAIFGASAPVKTMPKEYTSDGVGGGTVSKVTIEDLRKIATKEVTITINNSLGGRLDKVNAATPGY